MRGFIAGAIAAAVAACSSPPGPAAGSGTGASPRVQAPAPARPLLERVSSHRIELAGRVRIPGYLASFAFLVEMPDGSFRLGWNDERNGHITHLTAALTAADKADVVLADTVIAQLLALPDGDLAVAAIPFQDHLFNAFQTPLAVDLMRLSPAGEQRFRTRITGGQGTGPGQVWHAYSPTNAVRLAHSGGELGAFVKVSRNFAKSGKADTHQGDLFVVLDAATGALRPARTQLWSASHSNMLHLVTGADGHFLTLTVGDHYPFGIYFIDRSGAARSIVWPDEDQRTPEVIARVRSVAGAGSLCGFARRGDTLYASIGTVRTLPYDGFEMNADALLTRFDASGAVTGRSWLTDTPKRSESCPMMAVYGDGLIIATAERGEDRSLGQARAMVVDADGEIVVPTTELGVPMPDYNGDLVALADGGVAWAAVEYGASAITIVRLAPR